MFNNVPLALRTLAKGGPDAIAAYRATHNARSIDGLPALDG